ncbi:hypothetical protein TNCT_351921 [Trichonephila clavata]|uniref:Uncharacterized protein n=1 Tax=Trichonephila clavata TaxID=2740835 RepID=A0A8X6HW23_TRICU|nr:hypothetical protein TNCT_351921 [Trichonephila clavata]
MMNSNFVKEIGPSRRKMIRQQLLTRRRKLSFENNERRKRDLTADTSPVKIYAKRTQQRNSRRTTASLELLD